MAEDNNGASKEATSTPILNGESNGAGKGKAPEVNGTSNETTRSAKPKGESNGGEKAKRSDAGDGTQPKLSGAELKARAKAEKAARRAQTKDAKAPTAAAASGSSATPNASKAPVGDVKAGKGGKGKADQSQQKQQQNQATKEQPAAMDSRPSQPRRPSGLGRRPSIAAREKDPRSEIPDIFSHIPMAKRISTIEAHRDVHPAVLAVGQRMAAFALTDSILRLEGTLLALRKVLEEYETPEGEALTRHFVSHVLNPQIEYLTECRPMCFAMGNGIRHLKGKIRKFDINSSSDEAKKELLQYIDDFIRDRISFAELIIAKNAANFIEDGDRVLVLGSHRLVLRTLLQALEDKKRFDLHVVDDDDQTGQVLATQLANLAVTVSYSPANQAGLPTVMRKTSKVFLGTDGVFADGALYGVAGSADVATAAKDHRVPVIALCETINVDRERITADSLAYNEIHPDFHTDDSFRLLYNRVDPKNVDVIVTEFESELGNVRPGSILSVLRKQEDPDT